MNTKKNYHVSFILVITVVMMYLFFRISPDTFYSLFILKSTNILHVLPWQFLTYAFYFPEEVLFFIFTVLIFFWFSTRLESIWGSFHFSIYVLITLLSKSIFGFLLGMLPVYGNMSLYISLMVAFGFNFPHERIRLFFIIPIKVKILAIISLAIILIQIIGSLIYIPSNINIILYSTAFIKLPIKLSYFIFTLGSYLSIIIYFNKIFGENHFRRIFNFAKNNVKSVEKNIKEKNEYTVNTKYLNIYKKIINKEPLQEHEENLLDNIDTKINELCPDEDFESENNYCLTCDKYSKCIKKELIKNKMI